jgi:hypothetical protein
MLRLIYPGYTAKHSNPLFGNRIDKFFSGLEGHLLDALYSLAKFQEVKKVAEPEHWKKSDTITRKLPFFYAKTFVFALDGIGKILEVMAKDGNFSPNVESIKDEYYAHFSFLTGIRNSLHHYEDRLDGKAFKKPIPITPQLTELSDDPINILSLGLLAGDRYNVTVANGSYVGIEINEANLEKAFEIVQKLIGEFDWQPNFEKIFP